MGKTRVTGDMAFLRAAVVVSPIAATIQWFSGVALIVSIGWLLILWEWWLIGLGWVFGLAFLFLFPKILLLPEYMLMVRVAPAIRKGRKVPAVFLLLLVSVYGSCLFALWALAMFAWVVSYTGHVNSIPLVLWGSAIAVSPLIFIASQEPPTSTSWAMSAVFTQICYITVAGTHYSINWQAEMLVWDFIATAVLVVLWSLVLTVAGIAFRPWAGIPADEYDDREDTAAADDLVGTD